MPQNCGRAWTGAWDIMSVQLHARNGDRRGRSPLTIHLHILLARLVAITVGGRGSIGPCWGRENAVGGHHSMLVSLASIKQIDAGFPATELLVPS